MCYLNCTARKQTNHLNIYLYHLKWFSSSLEGVLEDAEYSVVNLILIHLFGLVQVAVKARSSRAASITLPPGQIALTQLGGGFVLMS